MLHYRFICFVTRLNLQSEVTYGVRSKGISDLLEPLEMLGHSIMTFYRNRVLIISQVDLETAELSLVESGSIAKSLLCLLT